MANRIAVMIIATSAIALENNKNNGNSAVNIRAIFREVFALSS